MTDPAARPGRGAGGRWGALLLLWLLTAPALPGGAARAAAQAPDTTAADTARPERPVEPLFTRRDAWFAGGFLLGTAALAPLDVAVARAVQDSSLQADRVLRGGADAFRWLGFPGVVLVTGGLYGAGVLAGSPALADVGLHSSTAIVVAEAVTIVGKAVVGRARPKLDTERPYDLDLFRGFTHDDYQSFPSGHTTAAFAAAAALTTEISRHRPEAKWWVGTLLFGGATLMGVSRLYHNEHWASDVMMGAAIGSFGGWKTVRYLHSHPDSRLNRWLLPRGALPSARGELRLVWSVPAAPPPPPAPLPVTAPTPRPQARPLVIAHRGASGHLPEHTLEAYRLAIRMGADFIEPDLVPTRDGVLVARHENEISGTTDVAERPEFADRRTTRPIDGREVTGWFTEDFSLAELRTLRARERLPELRPGSAAHDGLYRVPTLEEVLELAREESARRGRRVGVYPETKHPAYFRSIGLPLEERLVEALERHGYGGAEDPVFIQSFETDNLRALRGRTRVRLIQLLAAEGAPYDLRLRGDPRGYAELATPEGLAEIAGYADGIGPDKALILPRDAGGAALAPTRLVRDAHAAGLLVHPWTFRSESHFLPRSLRAAEPAEHGDAAAEYRLFRELGVDGVFTDFPDHALRAFGEDGAR